MENKEISKLQAITQMKCPRCHEGDLFKTSIASFKEVFQMPDRCEECGQNYMPEPGFYYGAMFISYGIWIWFCVFFGFTTIWFFGLSVNQAFLILLVISAFCFVWLFRISRSIWAHIAIKRMPRKKKKK